MSTVAQRFDTLQSLLVAHGPEVARVPVKEFLLELPPSVTAEAQVHPRTLR